MANVALVVTPSIRTFPFIVPPGTRLGGSAIPIARITFRSPNDVTIVAKIATNTTSIVATCTLPPNFAYTFEYAYMQVSILTDPGDADNFESVGGLSISFNDGLGTRFATMQAQGINGIAANAGSMKVWQPENPFPSPIFNQNGSSPNIILTANDTNAANTDEGDFGCAVSVLQYEFEQAFSYPLNFPLPVAQR